MNKPAESNPVREVTISAAILAAVLTGGVYLSHDLTGTPGKKITLIWDNPTNEVRGSFTTEVWASTNLTTWTLKTNVAGTNRVTLPADKAKEFFKIRNRGTNGLFSDWSRKPTL